ATLALLGLSLRRRPGTAVRYRKRSPAHAGDGLCARWPARRGLLGADQRADARRACAGLQGDRLVDTIVIRDLIRVDRGRAGQGVRLPAHLAPVDRPGASSFDQYRGPHPLPNAGRAAADGRPWRARLGDGDRAGAGRPAPGFSLDGAAGVVLQKISWDTTR